MGKIRKKHTKIPQLTTIDPICTAFKFKLAVFTVPTKALTYQAPVMFNLKLSRLEGVILHQLNNFPLAQVIFQNMYLDVLEP